MEEIKKNLLRTTAHLYDFIDNKDDIPFYLKYAKIANGKVLELACGTGRVSIPIAQNGHEVWGLDLSEQMLNQFKIKLNNLSSEIGDRIHLVHDDMSNFNIDENFSLIIIPFRSFQTLTTEKQQKSCLKKVSDHLEDEGYFIIDVFRPYAHLDNSWIRGEEIVFEKIDPTSQNHIRMSDIRREIDLENQIIFADLVFYVISPDGKEERLVEPLKMKYYYEHQIRNLLPASGFKIIEEMGYYDNRPISEGPELIFVCKK